MLFGTHRRKQAPAARSAEAELKKALGVMDRILVILGVFLFCFTVTMIVLFVLFGSTPDTLIMSVFGACAVEGGVMGWIKTKKEKIRAKLEELSQAPTDAQNREEIQ